jgi:hypothetical protein|tara:strand:- start:23271 stop:24824 length:1554 start_codon:yes stop_codon:yes gene_type:complete
MAEFFGFEITRKRNREPLTPVAPSRDDGSTVLTDVSAYYGVTLDLDNSIKSENALIKRYREVAQYPDCDGAIEDITNEAVTIQDDAPSVRLVLDDLPVSDSIKEKIHEEFSSIYDMLEFDYKGHDIFKTWYVDGRLYYHLILDPKNPTEGIQELRYVDPQKIRKIKNVKKKKNAQGIEVVESQEEYFIYNDKGITDSNTKGIKLSRDSVVFCPSGNVDQNTGIVLGHLQKAVKPVNQLKMIEDAVVIYRLSRAPERRIFYVDVGNLPKIKAEQYVNDIMNKYRNKVVYDATTGEVRDDRKHLSMMEDFWMPRREGGRGTEITTLPGGQNLGDIADIQYFQRKLYQSLNVPMSRLQGETGFTLGRASEITRDELKFNKFIQRVQRKFSSFMVDILRVQLISKGIMSDEDFNEMKVDIRVDFLEDNHFTELKNNELLQQRVGMLGQVEPYLGKFYSLEWARKNILMQSEEEIKEIDDQMDAEKAEAEADSGEGEVPDMDSMQSTDEPDNDTQDNEGEEE